MSFSGITNHFLIFFVYLAFLFCCFALFYGLGRLFLYFILSHRGSRGKGMYAETFLSLFTGVLLFSILVSLVYAHFKTIQVCFVGLFFLGVLTASKKNSALETNSLGTTTQLKPGIRFFWPVGVAITVYFLLQFYFTVAAYNFPFYQPSADLAFYSTVSDFLIQGGYENPYHAFGFLDESFRRLLPYHYFELWLTGGLSKLSGLNTFLVLTLVVSPLFFVLILLGLLAILEALGYSSLWIFFLCLLFPLMDRLKFNFFYELPLFKNADPFNSLLLSVSNNNVSKIGPYYLFLIPAILFMLQNNYRVAVLFILGLPVATITVAPAVFMGLSATVLLLLLFKRILLKEAVVYWGYIILLAAAIGAFYFLNTSATISPPAGKSLSMVELFTSPGTLRVRLNLFLGNVVVVFFVYMPFIALFLFGRLYVANTFKKLDLVIFTFISITLCGLLSWSILSHVPNGSQLGARLCTACMNLTLFIGTAILIADVSQLRHSSLLRGTLAGVFTVWLLYNGYVFSRENADRLRISEEYGKAVAKALHASTGPQLVGCFIAPVDFEKSEITKNSNFYIIGYYLQLFGNSFRSISLSDFTIPDEHPDDGDKLSIYARDGVFYDFVEEQKKMGTFVSIEKSQLDFIRENNFQYLVLSENYQLSSLLAPYVQGQYKDNISKETFVLLNNL